MSCSPIDAAVGALEADTVLSAAILASPPIAFAHLREHGQRLLVARRLSLGGEPAPPPERTAARPAARARWAKPRLGARRGAATVAARKA